jgi:hypothetical protein
MDWMATDIGLVRTRYRAGSFNPALSLAEDFISVSAIVLTIFIPLITLVIAPIVLGVVLGYALRRFSRRGAASS